MFQIVSPQFASFRLQPHSNDDEVPSERPGRSILKPERSSHATTAPTPLIDPVLLTTGASRSELDPDLSLTSLPTSAPEATTEITSDDEDEIVMRVAIPSLKERRKQSKQQLAAAKKEISDLRLETAEASRQLQEASQRIEKLKEAKETAEDRWRTYKGQFKKVLQMSKDANNRIVYLEKLLALEEKSGFSTRISEMQLQ